MEGKKTILLLVFLFSAQLVFSQQHPFDELIKSVGGRWEAAGYQKHEIPSKVAHLQNNDTTFYTRYLILYISTYSDTKHIVIGALLTYV